MPQLLTQSDVRPARDLPFCYLCGGAINVRADRHPDHIPPRAVFTKQDRNFPLKVAAHRECNAKHSPTDRVISQLIAVIHGRWPAQHDVAWEFRVFNVEGIQIPLLGVVHTNLLGQIGRWIRGFHAALYHEFLPYETPSAMHPPFPHGRLRHDGFEIDRILDQQYLFVEELKRNRLARCLDRIVCNNGKMIYECVWVRMDDGRWSCIFALQIYDWTSLADSIHYPKRGCVGWYQPPSGRPKSATKATDLEFAIENGEPLNAFGV